MAINGLDKITDKILAQAQEEADRILAEAQQTCDGIAAEYAAKAEGIRDAFAAQTEKEATDLITRARSAAAMQKRNLLLQTRGELMDAVFDDTLSQMQSLDTDKYTSLLVGLLAAAMLEQVGAEENSRTLYGEEDALLPSAYEVVMNPRDRERCGAAVLDGVRRKLIGKIPSERLDCLRLSDKTVMIDGGLILRCGDIESNCSLSLLFAQLRQDLEAEVGRALFEGKHSFG